MDALGAFSVWRMQEVLFRMSLKSEPTSTVRDLDQGHVILCRSNTRLGG
jgi:hypothetical protein